MASTMTAFLIDLASFQQGIDLSLPAYDPFGLVNIKTSQGNWYVANRDRSRKWADQARAKGKGIMTFHWLDASASGGEQARIAYREMGEIGGPDGMAHQADTEDSGARFGPLTYRIWSDYVNAMQDLLGRHVINYTGDWWWTNPARNWIGAALTPYLMAAPNVGYLPGYPGDASWHWVANYGGWPYLAAMQFHVGPIPNGGPGSGDVSQTAIRDPRVWAALTGGETMNLDYGHFGPPTIGFLGDLDRANCQGATLADLVAQEMDEHSDYDGHSQSARTKRLIRIEQKLTDLATNLKTVSDKIATLQLGGVDLDALAAKVAVLVPGAAQIAAAVVDEEAQRLGNG